MLKSIFTTLLFTFRGKRFQTVVYFRWFFLFDDSIVLGFFLPVKKMVYFNTLPKVIKRKKKKRGVAQYACATPLFILGLKSVITTASLLQLHFFL